MQDSYYISAVFPCFPVRGSYLNLIIFISFVSSDAKYNFSQLTKKILQKEKDIKNTYAHTFL